MTLVTNRDRLDSRLGEIDKTLLITIGSDEETKAVDSHATKLSKDGKLRPDQVPLRLDDTALLEQDELDDWEAEEGRFVTLSANGNGERVVTRTGDVSELLRADGRTPSTLNIKEAFVAGATA